jgi:hypothetical protein
MTARAGNESQFLKLFTGVAKRSRTQARQLTESRIRSIQFSCAAAGEQNLYVCLMHESESELAKVIQDGGKSSSPSQKGASRW